MSTLRAIGIDVQIHTTPDEVPNPIPFEQDQTHKSYERVPVEPFFRILVSVDTVLKDFRSRFIGKCSPVHFFWGSFDLAVTRFSGRLAPPRPDPMMQEAYSHEVISAGFAPAGRNQRARVLFLRGARTSRSQNLSDSSAARVLPLGCVGVYSHV